MMITREQFESTVHRLFPNLQFHFIFEPGDWSAWYSDKLVISYDRYHKMPWSISTNQATVRYTTMEDYNEIP